MFSCEFWKVFKNRLFKEHPRTTASRTRDDPGMNGMLFSSLASACNFNKKETLGQVFFCEFYEISKNIFFTEHLRATAYENH